MYNENILIDAEKELSLIEKQSVELMGQIELLEGKLKVYTITDGLTKNYNSYKNIINEIIDKIKAVIVLDNRWCEIYKGFVKGNNTEIPQVNFNNREEVVNALIAAEKILDINELSVSADFIEFYGNLLNKQHEFWINGYSEKLEKLSAVYYTSVVGKINKYKVDNEENKYIINGVMYELNSKHDIDDMLGIIEEYEKGKTQDIDSTVEFVKPIPLSQTSPEIQAMFNKKEKTEFEEEQEEVVSNHEFSFGDELSERTMELKNGAKVKIKQLKNKAENVFKLIGQKLVATKSSFVENLRAYYADINIAKMNEEEMDDFKESFDLLSDDDQFENLVATEKVESLSQTSTPTDKELLLSKYSDLINERIFGKHAIGLDGMPKDKIDFIIDNYLDNLIRVGEEKYGDNFVEDIMNEATSEPIKWLMDEVSFGEELHEITKDIIDQIDNMNENELEDYLGLTLTKDNLDEFNKCVNDYMKDRGIDEFTASKEVLKSMVNDVDLVKPSLVTGNENAIESNKIVEPISIEPNILEPEVISLESDKITEPMQPIYQEKPVNIIEKMDEYELNEYINDLDLSMDELTRFKSLVKQYKQDYPGVDDYMAKKACIKTIVDQREIEEYRVARTSTIEARK